MKAVQQIFSHILSGLVQLAELFDRSVTALITELDPSTPKEEAPKK